MHKLVKYLILTMAIVVMVCGSVSADFMAKTKMTMVGIPMVGNIEMEQSYLIKGDNYATVMTMSNPMLAQMGQPADMKTKSIIRKGGKEMVIVSYADSSYAIFDGAAMDSLAGIIEGMGGMLDSLKEMLTINKVDVKMTGNTKDVKGFKSEELALDIDIAMMLPLGAEPVPMQMTLSGSQWGTIDFADYPSFKKMNEVMQSMLLGGVGFSSFKPILDKLGIDQKVLDEAMKFAGYIPVEGSMLISLTPPSEGGTENDMMMPGMTFNIQMNTTLMEASTKAIPEAEFEIPKGFKKDDSLTPGQGGLGFPMGM